MLSVDLQDSALGVAAQFQSHGTVVLVDHDGVIRHATAGSELLLGSAPAELVGSSLAAVLPDVRLTQPAARGDEAMTGSGWQSATLRDGTALRLRAFAPGGGLVGLDVVPATESAALVESEIAERIEEWTVRLQAAKSRGELMRAASAIAVSLSGFEGAWAVRIDQDGNGFVEAATVSGRSPDTTGSLVSAIHLPPGDLTATRRPVPFFVADVAETPIELEPPHPRSLDFGASALHRPFGAYLSFLASIGVRATCSIPVVAGGATWGRIIGHDPEPIALTPAKHAELRLFGLVAGSRLQEILDEERREEARALTVASAEILRSVADAPSLTAGFRGAPRALLDLFDASSAVIAIEGTASTVGETLTDELTAAILADARAKFASNDRWSVATSTMPFSSGGHAGGYLAMRIDEAATNLVVWVRPERRQTVQWVAITDEPGEAQTLGDAVTNESRAEGSSSEPWTAVQLSAADDLRSKVASDYLERYGPLQLANTELERSNTEFDAFAHTIAHDLRAPLRGIHQHVELFMEDAAQRLTASDLQDLETVLRLTDRGTSLLDDLMRYAQLGEVTWATAQVDLQRAVEEAVEQLDREAIENAEIQVAAGRLRADPSALRQLLLNLIGNAVKYADGAARVQVGVRTLADAATISDPPPTVQGLPDHTTVLCVQDHGVGVAPEFIERAFGLFKRANQSLPQVPGTGVGLALCKRIAQRHGGDIWMTSALGVGTTVFVVLTP